LKKAAQKLLLIWAGGSETSTAQIDKVFLLLFVHKKKAFFLRSVHSRRRDCPGMTMHEAVIMAKLIRTRVVIMELLRLG
jgi:hypothetical protein